MDICSDTTKKAITVATGLAHEIKMPVSTIISSTNLIKKRLENNIKDEERLYFELIFKSCNEILRFAEHSISAIMFGSELKEKNFQKENICEFVLGLYEGIELFAKLNSISLKLNLVIDEKELFVAFSREYLTRALLNIISNSIKFSEDGSEILFEVREENKDIVFKISDNGIGIREEHLESIFDPYYTISFDNKITTGNGLGLFLVKSIAEYHNGSVKAESVYGKGTAVTLKIPKNLQENKEFFVESRVPNSKFDYSKELKQIIDVELSGF